jgi:predicted nucleotidyltransferase
VVFLAGDEGVGVSEDPPRWKNAYNLLRLLCSGIRWLTEGEPLMEVTGPLRQELLEVKRGEVPLDRVLERADTLAAELERAFETTRLPERPDHEAAHGFLLLCREQSAREHLTALSKAPTGALPSVEPQAPARFEIPEAELRAFLERYEQLDLVVCSLVGSHSYGFPSVDSDFDLKAIHLAPLEELLGLEQPQPTHQFLGDVEGLEIDFTSHEAGGALSRLLRGDGNVLERVLSPYLIAPGEVDRRLEELRALCMANLSRRFYRHYGGFFRGMVKLYDKERSGKIKTLLYMFRVALTGVHLLREGVVLADLKLLLEHYPFEPVVELFALKEQAELATVEDDRPYLDLVPRLEQLLEQAHAESTLPEEPAQREALDDWLRRWRHAGL